MKAAIISGASVGIGSATAELFAQEGYIVYCLARRECPVSGVNSIECDLSTQGSIDDACQRLERELVDCEEIALVHNASQMLKDRVDGCASDDLAHVLSRLRGDLCANLTGRCLLRGVASCVQRAHNE